MSSSWLFVEGGEQKLPGFLNWVAGFVVLTLSMEMCEEGEEAPEESHKVIMKMWSSKKKISR